MRQYKPFLDQRGMTSLMITMLMIVITSLIVLAFAQVARREQRTALDNQLSTQAYYAAESGVNDAKELINTKLALGQELPNFDDCVNDLTTSPNAKLAGNDVRYTCVTIDPNPDELTGKGSTQESTVFHLKSNTAFSSITITWHKPSNTLLSTNDCPINNDSANDQLAKASDWKCAFSVLRYDLTKVPASFTASDLEESTQTAFVLPQKPGGTATPVNFVPGNGDPIAPFPNGRGNRELATSCNTDSCSVTINGMSGNDYYLNLRLLYGSDAELNVVRSDGGEFIDSQAQIDVTGKAHDVLRRIRVALDISGDKSGAGVAMMVGDGPCKLQFLGLKNDGVTLNHSDDCIDDTPTVTVADDPPGGAVSCTINAPSVGTADRLFNYNVGVKNTSGTSLANVTVNGVLELNYGFGTQVSTTSTQNVAAHAENIFPMSADVPHSFEGRTASLRATVHQSGMIIATCNADSPIRFKAGVIIRLPPPPDTD